MPRQLLLALAVCLNAAGLCAQAPAQRPPQTPEGVRGQIALLSDPDPVTRAFAACYLAEMRRDAAAARQALTRLLSDATPIDPVACQREFPAATTFLAHWKSTPGWEAARALAAIGDDGIAALFSAAAAGDVVARRHAIRGLTYVRDARVESVFLDAIRDPDARTREDAARGLGRFRGPAVLEALLGGLEDRDPAVRKEAARALGRAQRRR